LFGRIVGALLPLLGRVRGARPDTLYLALRRIRGSRAIAVSLLVGAALPCGLLVYAGGVSDGVRHEITRKYQTNLGAPQVLNIVGLHEATPNLHGRATAVVRYATAFAGSGNDQVSVLGVDPATFDRFAYTTAAQRAAVRLLASTDSGVPAIVVNAPSGFTAAAVQIGASQLKTHTVGRADVFPGLRNGAFPMLVVNRAALTHIDPTAERDNEAWTGADQSEALSGVIVRAGYSTLGEVDSKVLLSSTGLLPVTWIFGYLRALALMIGAVAVAGLVFGLGARTRRRALSYVMSRRMGLTQRTHLLSLVIELGLVVGLGFLAGVAAGVGAFRVILGALDVYPSLPPAAALDLSVPTLVVTGAVMCLVIAVAAVATHLGAGRAHPAEVLRVE
ncbi:MAG: putative transport system permease protein, partial [Pseudonocardiales bacterium]|nr:putative transport system permease protein [Pseudonocardiales bacterium]